MNIFSDRDYFLFDGAMGTYYSAKNKINTPCEFANISERENILNIHLEYIEAGANAIKTNTFGANRYSLGCQQSEVDRIIKSGYDIAVQACLGQDVAVFADIGPIPDGKGANVEEEYKKIVDVFLECGAKNFLFETFAGTDILTGIAAYIRLRLPETVIITSFAVYPDGYSKEGFFYIDIMEKMYASGLVDAVGFNCISGPAHMYRLIKKADIRGKNIIIMPNSGYPGSERGRTVYYDNSEYYAEKLVEIKNLGVKILGGCCGTTPRHIAAAAKLLTSPQSTEANTAISTHIETCELANESIIDKLIKNKKPILVEIDPPFDTNWEYMLRDALILKQAGADIITIADSPLAKARAESTIMAAKIQREVAIPVMPHITCRDKNLLGIKASLLGVHIEGIRNVLVITGDPIADIERSRIKGVFSFNSSNLANYIKSLNSNVFCGQDIKIAGALNVNAVNFGAELKKAFTKIENGISCFLTQAIYTKSAVENLLKAVETLNIPIFAGFMPIVSYKNAQFINNEVPGIDIDAEIIEKFRDKSREESEKLGMEITMDIVEKIYPHVSGFYLMTPLKRTGVICELIKKIKEL
ncbi:methylenetetrahydrofolate reductase [Ruminiclostridium papyrosolvens DSM 2782]|uniref:Methylenetetrahydrofolate reductase n=1 Tax=Ruminiclostridium papyrosolvens DSM 2782 TaxID=588581 RepID=F1TGC2_9FIRM|nr:bifunctional homocysteine S-methyltransferase/methylenetetrahydrofolate reductase [Ruminiclostridium papyrosolvens]EGD46487.1 methylenetetrahydrofolate reductase [Ruminiclostridium papyrosolvens DSM 2782]WES35218.1 bifunctional homocysteine S-methyltransferase/methylenetetrahydrofolate reductase [Ruminiclostridium papyrosolvens DSM 2782]